MAITVALTSALSAISVAVFLNDAWPEALAGTYDFHGLEMVIFVDVAALVISWFAVGAWIYRAHANLLLTDVPAIDFTPASAIGWFAIPIANLFKPFQAMKALWRVSHSEDPNADETAPSIMWFWWIAWIASSLGGLGNEFSSLDTVLYSCTTVSAVFLIIIIRKITEAQPSMAITSTFE